MEDIRVEFTYDIADDQYHTTTDLEETATATYDGPAKQYWQISDNTNVWTGQEISYEQHVTYNERLDDGFYSVEIDCATNPLMCSLSSNRYIDTSFQTELTEVIANNSDYVRDTPTAPLHTYEVNNLSYNRATETFGPLPWKTSVIDWDSVIKLRNNQLNNSDRLMSEDLPTGLATSITAYRRDLRDFTKIHGASWIADLTAPGTGYAVGNRLAVTDSRLKANQAVDDVMITVLTVNGAGAILTFSVSSSRSTHIKAAATNTDVYHTTNGAGTGATFTISKNLLIDPWKLDLPVSPMG